MITVDMSFVLNLVFPCCGCEHCIQAIRLQPVEYYIQISEFILLYMVNVFRES